MKIMMLTDYFYPHIGGGVEKVVYEISKLLVKFGCDVSIVTFNTMKAKEFEFLDGLKIYRIKPINLTRALGVQLTISPSVPFKILNICKKENPDIIHANNRFFFTTICAVALKNILGKPLITTLHLGPMTFGKGWFNFFIKAYEQTISKWIIKKSNYIIAVSNVVKELALSLGSSSEKITVIRNGVDINEFKIKNHNVENLKQNIEKRIVFVGRLIQNKGVKYLIEAAPTVLSKYQNAKFIIVGDGPMKKELKIIAKREGVQNAFQFLGFVPSVADVLNQCDIFVRPSLTEGMPLTVLEAMSCGLPVVATKVAGTPEIVINDETGILIEPGNNKELANSLIHLLDDYEFSKRLRNNARLFVEKYYSWEKTANLTYDIYRKILNSNH